jgi:hypothetical protein
VTQEGDALSPNTSTASGNIEGQVAPSIAAQEDDAPKSEVTLPPQAVRMLMELTEMRTSFGPDPETARIISETERHAEEKKLEGYKATLEHRDKENERKHIRLLKKISNESKRTWVVLIASIITAIGGILLAITGKSNLGIPLLVFAGILIKDLSGKSPSSTDSE